MTAATNDESDWVGISRPVASSRVIGELTMRRPQDLLTAVEDVRLARQDWVSRPSLANSVRMADGELAALGWVLGREQLSPITGQVCVDVTNPRNVDRERNLATDMLQRRNAMDGRGDRYVAGVEMTLMWILNEADNAPG